MDTIKVANFLKELRKARNLTQEQVADRFNISSRTVSRWENASNMPDISILMELSEFYEVDIKEILNGERTTKEEPAEPEAEMIKLVADYADKEKNKLAFQTRIYAIVGLCALIVYKIAEAIQIDHSSIWIKLIQIVATVLIYIALTTTILYTTGKLKVLNRKTFGALLTKIFIYGLVILGGITLLILIGSLLMVGSI